MSAAVGCLRCLVMAWIGIASAFRRVEPANPQVECLCDEPVDEDDAKVAAVDPGDVTLKREEVTADSLQELSAQPVQRLTLMHCSFAGPMSSEAFAGMALQNLVIYSPAAFAMSDGLRALARMESLRSLQLVRADFVNHEAAPCYAALSRMTQLEYLSLERTITREKAPGRSTDVEVGPGHVVRQVTELDPIVMESLERLLRRGNLKTLNLKYCTALSEEQVDYLRSIRPDCEILPKRSKQVSASASSSAKPHDD
jgi:hypothetical protein